MTPPRIKCVELILDALNNLQLVTQFFNPSSFVRYSQHPQPLSTVTIGQSRANLGEKPQQRTGSTPLDPPAIILVAYHWSTGVVILVVPPMFLCPRRFSILGFVSIRLLFKRLSPHRRWAGFAIAVHVI